MPTYGYRCTNCGNQFEIFQRMSDEPLKVCPKCSQTTLKKVVYPAGVVFKGSGFYTTDYKGSGRSSGNGSASGSEGSSEKKSDPKPEAKSESKSDSGD